MSLVAMFGADPLFQPSLQVAISRPFHEQIFTWRRWIRSCKRIRPMMVSTINNEPETSNTILRSSIVLVTKPKSTACPVVPITKGSWYVIHFDNLFVVPCARKTLTHVKDFSSMGDYHFKGNCRIMLLPHQTMLAILRDNCPMLCGQHPCSHSIRVAPRYQSKRILQQPVESG